MAKTAIYLLNQKEITDINSKMVVSNLFIKWKEEEEGKWELWKLTPM